MFWMSGDWRVDRHGRPLYNAPRSRFRPGRLSGSRRDNANTPRSGAGAQVAQLVEHAIENRSVGGSIPPLGTTLIVFSLF